VPGAPGSQRAVAPTLGDCETERRVGAQKSYPTVFIPRG
jgi:hypothetical protein